MNDRRGDADPSLVDEEIELDADTAEDIDEAMEAALESLGEEGGEGRNDDGDPPAAADASPAEQAAEIREKWLRTLADFDNYRKRIQRERAEAHRYEGFHLLQQFVGIVDNLERALEAGGNVEDLKTGVEMILRQMRSLLDESGVERIAAVGEAFDPNVHDAVSREDDPEVERPTVVSELQAGYTMHDRLLRAARVGVAVPASDDGADGEGEG